MKLFSRASRILVPIRLPEPDDLPDRMVERLGNTRILLVGWLEVPEQTPPEQAKEELDDTGEAALARIRERLEEAGAEVETRHLFTPDLIATIQSVGAEEACDAALIAGPIRAVDRVLVVLRDEPDVDVVARLVADLSEDRPDRVTLLHISEDEADLGRDLSDRVLNALEQQGVDTDRVETRVEASDEPEDRVVDVCREDDVEIVVVPEHGEMEERLFGSFAARLARDADMPVLVVRMGGSD
ncbi:MAG TPA: universal stress protein [Longimicrobiales bacterium]|nr:universal stress protein [Longimicrobiales bacterium]